MACSFALPQTADAEKVAAEYRNGVLELKLPKRPEAKAKETKVAVKAKRPNSSASRLVPDGRGGWLPLSYKDSLMAIRFDKLTLKAQQALQEAQERAAARSHQEITELH